MPPHGGQASDDSRPSTHGRCAPGHVCDADCHCSRKVGMGWSRGLLLNTSETMALRRSGRLIADTSMRHRWCCQLPFGAEQRMTVCKQYCRCLQTSISFSFTWLCDLHGLPVAAHTGRLNEQCIDHASLAGRSSREDLEHGAHTSPRPSNPVPRRSLSLARHRQGEEATAMDAIRWALFEMNSPQPAIRCRPSGLHSCSLHCTRSFFGHPLQTLACPVTVQHQWVNQSAV